MTRILAFLFLLLSTYAFSVPVDVTHVIETDSIMGGKAGKCSSTAIAPQALLTATHCEGDVLTVDGEHAVIKEILRDGRDHSILLIQGVRFEKWARINPEAKIDLGTHLSMVGNPGSMKTVYREGYVAATDKVGEKDDIDVYYLDINGFFGDSGSGLFNNEGDIVGVISSIRVISRPTSEATLKFIGAYALAFDSDQLQMANTYCQKCDPPKKEEEDKSIEELRKRLLDIFKDEK